MPLSSTHILVSAFLLLLQLSSSLRLSEHHVKKKHKKGSTLDRVSIPKSFDLANVAVGVNTGGLTMQEHVSAVKDTWLSKFVNNIVTSDKEHKALGVNSVDKKYYCSHESEWKPRDFAANGMFAEYTWESDWNSRGRCTQQRFLYLLLELREKFPQAAFYVIVDDDVWVNTHGMSQYLATKNPEQKFVVGYAPETWGEHPFYVWSGPGLIFSSAVVKTLDPTFLMTQASLWEFSCAFHDCCDWTHPACSPNQHAYIGAHFNLCNERLTSECAKFNSTSDFEQCISLLDQTDQDDCHFHATVPEYPVPMYYEPMAQEVIWKAKPVTLIQEWSAFLETHTQVETNPPRPGKKGTLDLAKHRAAASSATTSATRWNDQHGCDHTLSFAARQAGATLFKESGVLSWYHKDFSEWERAGVCPLISQHQLTPDEIRSFETKFHEKCPPT